MDVQLLTASEADRHRAGLPLRLLGDERLARLVAQGREAAFAELYGRYHQPLFRYCRSIVGTDSDAQDALQSALTRAFVALRESRRDAPLRPWLYRIAHNESISLLRRRRPEFELPEELSGASRSAHETAEERAELATLLADLAELPERQRGALVMRELSGLGHEEIAAAFGVSTGAAKQTIFEARRALQEFAEGRAMGCEEIQRIVSDGDRRALRGRRVRAHLRDCALCDAFATAIPARTASLRAATPMLPGAVAAGLFARITGSGSVPAGGGAGGAAISGLGALISGKALMTGAAVLATAAIGTETVHRIDAGTVAPPAVAGGHVPAAGGASAKAAPASGAGANVTATLRRIAVARAAAGDRGIAGRSLAGAVPHGTRTGAAGIRANHHAVTRPHAGHANGKPAASAAPGASSHGSGATAHRTGRALGAGVAARRSSTPARSPGGAASTGAGQPTRTRTRPHGTAASPRTRTAASTARTATPLGPASRRGGLATGVIHRPSSAALTRGLPAQLGGSLPGS